MTEHRRALGTPRPEDLAPPWTAIIWLPGGCRGPLGAALVKVLKERKVRSKHSKDDNLVFPNNRGAYTGHDNMVKRQ